MTQRHDGDGQKGVGDEDREVERPHPPRPWEPRDHAVAEDVVGDVADEEKERGEASREHESAMHGDVVTADEDVGDGDEHTAGGVEGGIDRGEEAGDFQRAKCITAARPMLA